MKACKRGLERACDHRHYSLDKHNRDSLWPLHVTTLNFHILRVATSVSCSSLMRKYNSYMNIIYNLNFEKCLKQLIL